MSELNNIQTNERENGDVDTYHIQIEYRMLAYLPQDKYTNPAIGSMISSPTLVINDATNYAEIICKGTDQCSEYTTRCVIHKPWLRFKLFKKSTNRVITMALSQLGLDWDGDTCNLNRFLQVRDEVIKQRAWWRFIFRQ